MKWLEVSVKTNQQATEAVSEILTRFGANGVSIEDNSNFEKDLKAFTWDYIDDKILQNDGKASVKAYYSDELDNENILKQIKDALEKMKKYVQAGEVSIFTKYVNDEDWKNEWKKYYKPLHIGKSILIKPTWENADSNSRNIVIELDPGMAFGTGTHESTKMCAEFLEKYIKKGNKLLDIGCGSGILSIIAAKLGCSRVLAIDLDPVAVKTAQENIEMNNVADIISTKEAVLEKLQPEKYNIIAANIVADVIINLTPLAKRFIPEGGLFVVSGIIRSREQEVEATLEQNGYRIIDKCSIGEWVAMVAEWENSL